MMTIEYRLLARQYVLHTDGKPTGRPTAQLSLAFNRNDGTLYKHGEPAMVQTWGVLALKKLVGVGRSAEADDLVVVTGQLPLDEVNRCLDEGNYCAEFYARLMDGEFTPAQVA